MFSRASLYPKHGKCVFGSKTGPPPTEKQLRYIKKLKAELFSLTGKEDIYKKPDSARKANYIIYRLRYKLKKPKGQ